MADRITPHRCGKESLGFAGPVDFALAFWMAHEVPDKPRFFGEIFALLGPAGRLLLVEPKYHVSAGAFCRTVEMCREQGFSPTDEPAAALSRAVLMGKGESRR